MRVSTSKVAVRFQKEKPVKIEPLAPVAPIQKATKEGLDVSIPLLLATQPQMEQTPRVCAGKQPVLMRKNASQNSGVRIRKTTARLHRPKQNSTKIQTHRAQRSSSTHTTGFRTMRGLPNPGKKKVILGQRIRLKPQVEEDRLTRGLGTATHRNFMKNLSRSRRKWAVAPISGYISQSRKFKKSKSVRRDIEMMGRSMHAFRKFPTLSNCAVPHVKVVDNDYHTKNTNPGYTRNSDGKPFFY